MAPSVVIRPILPAATSSVNHRFPSGLPVMSTGWPPPAGRRNSGIAPPVVIRPILFWNVDSVNHRLPSGPAVLPVGLPPVVGGGHSLNLALLAAAAVLL